VGRVAQVVMGVAEKVDLEADKVAHQERGGSGEGGKDGKGGSHGGGKGGSGGGGSGRGYGGGGGRR